MKFAIGIDLGGTRIKGVAMDADGNILHQLYKPTNDGDDAVWKNAVADTVNELQGKINGNNSVLVFLPRACLTKIIQRSLICPVACRVWKIFHGVIFCKNLLMY